MELSFANGGTFLAVKRVIGLPGDVITCPASTDGYCHAWTRNGRPLSEPWIGRDRLYPPNDPTPLPGFFVDGGSRIVPFPAVTVTPEHVFLLGDNRDNAVDSRISKPVLQKLSAVKGVGVQVIGTDGHRRPIPGAPPHDVPGPGGTIDPPAAPPDLQQQPGHHDSRLTSANGLDVQQWIAGYQLGSLPHRVGWAGVIASRR